MVAQRRVKVPAKVIVVERFDNCWISSFGNVHPRGGWYQRHLFDDVTRDSVENLGKVHEYVRRFFFTMYLAFSEKLNVPT